MEPFTLQWAAEGMNGRIIGDVICEITSVCIDSRQAKPGALFFALKGEHSDGHDYVAQALRAGAVAVVERPLEGVEEKKGAQVVVPATLRALGDLSRRYRRQFAIPIIGVTGSVGKTSTKEMIAAVLRTTYNTLANEKNYNNEIGVPLTLFNLNKTHEVAVVEMGMRGLGQIDYLAEIAEPTIGVITNIGYSHIELLGSQENIARAKAELFARLPANGIAILAEELTFWPLIFKAIGADGRKIVFTAAGINSRTDVRADYRKVQIHTDGTVSFRVRVGPTTQSIPVKLQAIGTHHVPNALAALSVAYALEIPTERAIAALEAWQGAEGRMTVRHVPDKITVLDDCYNASPESISAALQTLQKMSSGGVAVLGDIRELGDHAEQAHRDLRDNIVESGIRLLITVGELAALCAEEVETFFLRTNAQPNAEAAQEQTAATEKAQFAGKQQAPVVARFHDSQEAAAHIKDLVQPGDTVLVKGSRAMGMEVIVDALTGETDSNAHA